MVRGRDTKIFENGCSSSQMPRSLSELTGSLLVMRIVWHFGASPIIRLKNFFIRSVNRYAKKAAAPDGSVHLDLCQDDHCHKNQKLFSTTSARTVNQEQGSLRRCRELTPTMLGNSSKQKEIVNNNQKDYYDDRLETVCRAVKHFDRSAISRFTLPIRV